MQAPDVVVGGFRKWKQAGLELLFAPECAFCGGELWDRSQNDLCAYCVAAMAPVVPATRCARCGMVAPPLAIRGDRCVHCRGQAFHFQSVTPLGDYGGDLRAAVLRMKRPGQEPIAFALARLLWNLEGPRLMNLGVDAVAPIPMHWRRRIRRGVNNPEILAERLAGWLGIPLARGLLVRRRNTRPQADLSPHQRFRNVRDAFRPGRGYHLEAARVLLVDDVLTTGATASEAAKTLRRLGASAVDVAVIARTRPSD